MADEMKKVESKKDDKKSVKKADKKPSMMSKIKKFLKEVKSEISKVVWPSPKQVINNTLVVIVVVALASVFIGAVDSVFKLLAGLLAI